MTFFIATTVFSQEPKNSFDNNLCNYSSNNKGESKGININYFVPCEWGNVENDGPHVIAKFLYKKHNSPESFLVSTSLSVTDLEKSTTDGDIKTLLSEEGLRILTKSWMKGTYESFSKLMVNGVKGGQAIIKTLIKRENSNLFIDYTVQNYFVYNRKLILIQYAITSSSKEILTKYLSFFKTLLGKTSFNM